MPDPATPWEGSAAALERLLRERDQLLLLHEALADVGRASSLDERLRVLVEAIQRVGFGRVHVVEHYQMPPESRVVARISASEFLNTNTLIVPLRTARGAVLSRLVLGDPVEPGPPSTVRVRTVELFAQEAATIIENARLYDESQRERGRGEALGEIARAVSASLRVDDVLELSLRHAVALLRTEGATLSLLRDAELVVVAGTGAGECLRGSPVPVDASVSGLAIRERRAFICNDANIDEAYAPSRIAANVRRTLVAPLFSSTEAVGVLAVINRDSEFTTEDATVLQRLADQVAVAVTNARLYEDARAVAERYRGAVEDERRARDAVAQSEARYRNLIETATDAIYTLDTSGSFSSVNEATCALVGRTREELLGRSPLPLVASREAAMVKEHFKSALAGSVRGYECQFVRPDGDRRLASVTNTPVRHGNRVIGVLGVARDVTEERDRAAALQRSEMRYTRLVESASDAIFTVDTAALFTSANRALERASGRSRDELIGTPFDALIDPRDRAAAVEAIAGALHGNRRRVELRYPSPDGELRYCSLMITPLVEGGDISGALGVVRDITDEHRLAEQLMEQEKLAAVGQLVSGVAHELNNPLASVMAFAQLLLAAPAGAPTDRHAVETITQEAKRAAKIVSNLLTFARQHQPERAITDLNRIVEDTLELRRYALRVAQIDVELRLDPLLPLTWADPYQLQQVVLNLFTNAEHALGAWDGDRRLAIATEHSSGHLRVRVSDSGPGIAPEHLPRIFNPFFTTKPVGQGTGLGLSISDGIVREHDGRIRVESRPGRGAAFTIELPYVAPPEPGGQVPAPPQPVGVAAKRLLVVDDEAALRSAIASYFRSLGHAVDVVGMGRDAIARAAETRYDALVLDLRLPDLGGDEVLAELRARSRAPARVVFMTGDTQSEQSRRLLDATGCARVAKPFLLDELAAVVLAAAEA